jgi:DNA helicase II / ATP-dependent DNA helicase PcrA
VRAEVPYQVIGGTKFYERAEIKDAIAYLSLLSNPQDSISFTRIANSPRRGLGQTSLARVTNHARSIDVPIWEAAMAAEQVPGLGAAAVKALRRFMNTMAELRQLRDRAVPVADLLEALLAQTGYIEALEAERSFEAQGRIENLQELIEVAREFDAGSESGEDTLDVFLAQIALVADADARRDEDGLVTLMTLHNAKGLEYPVVFIVGCEDGVFPHSRSLEEGGLEEERRLFYVGVTRAMRQLHMSYARRRAVFGAQTYGLRSRFLDEIPPELTDSPERVDIGSGNVALTAGAFLGAGARSNRALVGVGGGWDSAARAAADSGTVANGASAARGSQVGAGESFRLGEDVVDPKFGDGVVVGLRADGVVVRFARDGSERTLLTEFLRLGRR